MPPSLNPKPKPVFKNMVMAFAGDIGTPEAQARQYLSLRQGSHAAKFDETVTHVLATAEQFKEKGPLIKSALASKTVKIVQPDWFTNCMFQNKLLAITPWSHRAKNQTATGKVAGTNASGGAKGKQVQSIEAYVDTERHHLWKDETGFEYSLKLHGKDDDWLTLELWESNALPHLYHCVGHYFKKKSTKQPQPWRVSELPGNFEREYKLFRGLFFKKTGVKWDQRIEAADNQGLIKSRITGINKPSYDYQLPMANMPRGVLDVFPPQRPQKPKQSQSDAGKAIRAMNAPATKTAAMDSSVNPSQDPVMDKVTRTLEKHAAEIFPTRKRPSLAPDIDLPSPPPSSPMVSAQLGLKSGKHNLAKPSNLLMSTPKSRKIQQPRLATPQTPDQLVALGLTPALTPTAPKKASPMVQASMKRKLDALQATPTGNVQKKLAVRASVDEDKLKKAKMATEARPKTSEPDASNKSADNSGIIDIDHENGKAGTETHVDQTKDAVAGPGSDEQHDALPHSGLSEAMLESVQPEKDDSQEEESQKCSVIESSIEDDDREIEDKLADVAAEEDSDGSCASSSTD
ncbi:hypothetical protein KJ359_012516 [Pestalotiopsis sp. 9143b]|nr:hypothetical protein KJ359_012516 [Pestalotiopsis sp. 9143b]